MRVMMMRWSRRVEARMAGERTGVQCLLLSTAQPSTQCILCRLAASKEHKFDIGILASHVMAQFRSINKEYSVVSWNLSWVSLTCYM